MTDVRIVPASYKDPAGFVFMHQQQFYRQVNKVYTPHYDLLIQSGLYKALTEQGLLIGHTETNDIDTGDVNCYKILLPTQLEFTSYPYEWSFEMLKDAALLTLEINRIAIEYGMILKDATAFNVQFQHCRPIFIDTLSFEKYDATKPWIAYRQFCECFLFPLYLCHYTKTDAQKWLAIYPDGINVTTTASLLPARSRFKLGVWLHVYLQKNISRKQNTGAPSKAAFSKQKLMYLLDGLSSTIKNLSSGIVTDWNNYYNETILSTEYLREKEIIFRDYLQQVSKDVALDLGANDGFFSQIAAEKTALVLAVDADSNCIDNLYKLTKEKKIKNILPLIIDLTNPSAAIGFENGERLSFFNRTRPSLALALALVHHLVISKNVPLQRIAAFLSKICSELIIEFVDKEDPKTKELLKNKEDIYSNYTEAGFEQSFGLYFNIAKKDNIPGTKRVLYLMHKK